MSDIPLKPCPFCGGAAEMSFSPADDSFPVSLYGVNCSSCTCNHGSSEQMNEAIKEWNTRATDDSWSFVPPNAADLVFGKVKDE